MVSADKDESIESATRRPRPWRKLPPVEHPWQWVAGGVPIQVMGVAMPASYLISQAHREGIGGHITAATIKLIWHSQAHTGTGVAMLISGAVVFAAGSVLIARPYVRRPLLLLAAVPLAGVVGMLLLGAFALLLAFVFDFSNLLPDSFDRKRPRGERRRGSR